MDKLLAVFMLVYQLGDFVLKAILSFAGTPEGADEWADVQAALVTLGLVDVPTPSSSVQNRAVSEMSNDEIAAFVREQAEMYERETQQSAEQQRVDTPAPRRVVRSPKGGEK